MIFELDDDSILFPPAKYAEEDGLLAFGGDLSASRLLEAYKNGIFPWFEEGSEYLWWSPDPRLVIKPLEVKVSKSLRKVLKDNIFEIKFDTNFPEVMKACAETARNGQTGSWITEEMIAAYSVLHEMGFAHSIEAYREDRLVGGLYGLAIGKVFFGESMFHQADNASKVSFVKLCNYLAEQDFKLIDAQQDTPHLRSLGAYTIPRTEFLLHLSRYVDLPTLTGKWALSSETTKSTSIINQET